MTSKDNSRRQTSVMFYGDDIIAIQELEPNETYVPIAALCAKLGLERGPQERRTRAHVVLGAGARLLPVEHENRVERMLCLRVDLLPLWLAGVDASRVGPEARDRLELFQRESASVLWQAFRPQGFGVEDELLPTRHEQTPAEQSYVAALGMATLARHQMLIERQLNARPDRGQPGTDGWSPGRAVDDASAVLLAQAVRRV